MSCFGEHNGSLQDITLEFAKTKLQFYPCHTENLTIIPVFLL